MSPIFHCWYGGGGPFWAGFLLTSPATPARHPGSIAPDGADWVPSRTGIHSMCASVCGASCAREPLRTWKCGRHRPIQGRGEPLPASHGAILLQLATPQGATRTATSFPFGKPARMETPPACHCRGVLVLRCWSDTSRTLGKSISIIFCNFRSLLISFHVFPPRKSKTRVDKQYLDFPAGPSHNL